MPVELPVSVPSDNTASSQKKHGLVIATDWTRLNAAVDCGGSLSRASSDLSSLPQYQHDVQGGRCGICGDPFGNSQPRAHEIGGPYYTGILVRNYTEGQVTTRRSLPELHFSRHVRVDRPLQRSKIYIEGRTPFSG